MTIYFGGDYNPEQWDEAIWDEDVHLMVEAGVNLVTVGVFSWAKLEPRPGEFDFGWLDRVLDKLHEAGIGVDLATATASPPPWLSSQFPESRPVTEDGVRLAQGSRQAYCPSSPVYRALSARLCQAVVERYASHPAVRMWHINNEYACHVGRCYCSTSASAFREWLTSRYKHIDALNHAWGTAFWSQQYGSFDEIDVPARAPYFRNPGQLLDFDRFSNDEVLACFKAEAEIVRAASDLPLTTNFMGMFKPLDYWEWAEHVDFVSDDTYPDPADPDSHEYAAMTRDLMRSLAGQRPWVLMEQAAGAVNWRPRNARKRPGQMRAWSLQAWARGARGILFFQWRQSEAGGERFHSAMLPHGGPETRLHRRVAELGAELKHLPVPADTLPRADVAILLDWPSWWGLEQPGNPSMLSYLGGVRAWYRTLFQGRVRVDFVSTKSDLSRYRVVVVPTLFVADTATRVKLDEFARGGGSLLMTYQSIITDDTGRVVRGGALAELRDTFGIDVEEFAPLSFADPSGTLTSDAMPEIGVEIDGFAGVAGSWAEEIVASRAEVVMTFTSEGLEGCPAATVNQIGVGSAWYVATLPDDAMRSELISQVLARAGIDVNVTVPGLEIIDQGEYLVAINHWSEAIDLSMVDARFAGVSALLQDEVALVKTGTSDA